MRLVLIVLNLFTIIVLSGCTKETTDKNKGAVKKKELDFRQLPWHVFKMPEWTIWAQNVVKGDDGKVQRFERLEMQKLYFEDGQPKALFLGGKPEGTTEGFGIAIDLRPYEFPPSTKLK